MLWLFLDLWSAWLQMLGVAQDKMVETPCTFVSMKRILLILVIILTSGTAGFLYYLGLFSPLTPLEGTEGGYLLGGVYHTGPYEEIGPAFSKVQSMADSMGILTETMVGCYFDNPKEIEADSLHSFVGVVLATGEEMNTPGNMDYGALSLYAIGKGEAIMVDFPRKNDLSMIIGAIRVYPFLTKEAEARGFEVGEVYEIYSEDNIRYVFQAFPVAQDSTELEWELEASEPY